VKNLGATESKINCIPNNEQKYISFSKEHKVDFFFKYRKTGKIKNLEDGQRLVDPPDWQDYKVAEVKCSIRFLDSFTFMGSSLASLVKDLPKEGFKHLEKHF
jgi:hypothetical protein